MAPRDLYDPTQVNWLDLMRAMAWAPPNLPLFPSSPSVANGVPPGGVTRGSDAPGAGDASSAPWPDPSDFARGAAVSGAIDPAGGPTQWPGAASAQFGGPPPDFLPARLPVPRRRPPNAPQLLPVGLSQASPWSPNVSGSTPRNAPSPFDARWSGSAQPPSLLDMSNVASPISQQTPNYPLRVLSILDTYSPICSTRDFRSPNQPRL